MSRSELGRLVVQHMEVARTGDPDACRETLSGTTRQVDGLRSEAQFGSLRMTIDEPVSFGGTGLAPNPAEVVLAALGASLEVTLRCYAEYLEISLRDIVVHLHASLDTRGFFGSDPAIRSGFGPVTVTVELTGEYTRAQLQELLARVDRACPVLDILRVPVEVGISVSSKSSD